MIAESTSVAQVEEPVASTGAEDDIVQTSTTVKSIPVVVVSEATIVTISEVPVTTLVLTEPVVNLISAPSEMASVSTDTVRTIIEKRSGSASTELTPAMDIMKELAHQMVQQFFTSMMSCIELVLSERSSFEFSRMLFKTKSRIFVILKVHCWPKHI